MKKTNKIGIVFITVFIVIVMFIVFSIFKISNNIKKKADFNGCLNISKNNQIITLGTKGMPYIAESIEEAKNMAEQYFLDINKNEGLSFDFKNIKEDTKAYYITYAMPISENTREYYFKYKLQVSVPKKEANITLYIFKKSYYDGKKIYAKKKSDVKMFGDMAILYRKLNYNTFDQLITSKVAETKNEYIYTAYVISSYTITSKKDFNIRI